MYVAKVKAADPVLICIDHSFPLVGCEGSANKAETCSLLLKLISQ